MEFKNFDEFYQKAYDLAIRAKGVELNSKLAIIFARKSFFKSDLNSYYSVGSLKKEQLILLGAKTPLIKFSIDSLIKNIIKHPEISYAEYLKISLFIKKPDKISLSKTNSNSILLLKKDNKYYQLVIKTTENKKENFLTSFRMLKKEEFEKY